MGAPNCPHCGVELPSSDGAHASEGGSEAATPVSFCPSCGRRVEGWKPGFRAALGGAAVGGPLPGSEEPTRAIATSPSLLRAAGGPVQGAAPEPSPQPPAETSSRTSPVGETDSVLMRTVQPRRTPLILVGLLCVGGAVAVFALRRPHPEPAPPAPAVATPAPSPSVASPSAPPSAHPGKPRRISAPPIAKPEGAKTEAAVAKKSGPSIAVGEPNPSAPAPSAPSGKIKLPAGSIPGATPSAPTGAKTAQGPLPTAVNETLENEATPLTEEERRAEAAARVDADGVRFVVRSHLPQVHACYSRAFKDESPGGRVDIGFVVNAGGKAAKIRTEANSTNSPALSKCLEQRIAEWDFPRPSGGEFELIYPFVFSPGT